MNKKSRQTVLKKTIAIIGRLKPFALQNLCRQLTITHAQKAWRIILILSFDKINKFFGDKHILKDISFECKSGRAFGLLGRNGAGKTTSIRILMGVFQAESGKVYLDGIDLKDKRRNFAYLPEEKGLYPRLNILRQMSYIGELRGLSKKDAKKRSKELLERLQIGDYAGRKLETLSKGNQQKIQLAVDRKSVV